MPGNANIIWVLYQLLFVCLLTNQVLFFFASDLFIWFLYEYLLNFVQLKYFWGVSLS